MMISLSDSLLQRTWRELRAISRTYGLPFNSHEPKRAARQKLFGEVLMDNRLKAAFKELTEVEREPLLALQAAGGSLPYLTFMQAFGVIRPYRPWDVDSPRQAWKKPISVAEKLWYLALITIDGEMVSLPDEVLRLLPPLPVVLPVGFTESAVSLSTSLVVDLAHVLGVRLVEDIQIRWDRC